MAFESVSLPRKYFKYKECVAGQVLCEGTFIKQGKDKFKNDNYEFRNDDEKCIYLLNSAGHLNFLMKEYVDFGDYCRVTYKGEEKLTKGRFAGEESHQFEVEIDPERKSAEAVDKGDTSKAPTEHDDEGSSNSLDEGVL